MISEPIVRPRCKDFSTEFNGPAAVFLIFWHGEPLPDLAEINIFLPSLLRIH